jgi:hypothetical protein
MHFQLGDLPGTNITGYKAADEASQEAGSLIKDTLTYSIAAYGYSTILRNTRHIPPVPPPNLPPHLIRPEVPHGQGTPQSRLLGRPIGRRQAAAAAVLVHGAPREQGQAPGGGSGPAAPSTHLLLPRPQHQCTAALRAEVSVCRCVECLAAALGGQHASAVAGLQEAW